MDIIDSKLFQQLSVEIASSLPQEAINILMHPWMQTAFLGEVRYEDQHPNVKAYRPRVKYNIEDTMTDKERERLHNGEEKFVQDLEDEFPDYYVEWYQIDGIWQFVLVFKWLINAAFIALPWSFISQLLLIYNLWFNIKWNFLWAGGNVFLLGNTIYALWQGIHSIFLVTEMPFWMKLNKGGRWLALGAACVYNIVFVGIFADFLALLYYYDKADYDVFRLFESMFFAYNIAIHFPITITNAVIILKEFSLEFVQMSQKRKGRNERLALGIAEWIEWFNDAEWAAETGVETAYDAEKRYLKSQ